MSIINLTLGLPERWQERALCREIGGELWFPENGFSTRPAKQICAACPVQGECLDTALAEDPRYGVHGAYGVWGGLSEKERRLLRKPPTAGAA